MNKHNNGIAWLALFLSFALFSYSSIARAGLMPNSIPQQEEAIGLAGNFLLSLDYGDTERAYQMLGKQALQVINQRALITQVAEMRSRFGANQSQNHRQLIEAVPSKTLPNTQRPGTYLTIRFRSVYPAGAIFQDVFLEHEQEGRFWKVIGWWFSPANY